MAKEHDKGEGAGGGCAACCAEREAPFYKMNNEWDDNNVQNDCYTL
jgi:hypothetical protein